MRFCTTHRACESEALGDFCIAVETADSFTEDPCTLVDALIVTKEDGEWPEWATEITIPPEPVNHPMRRVSDLKPPYSVFDGHKILDALYEAAKETP